MYKVETRGRPRTVGKNGTPRKVTLLFSEEQYKLLESRARHEDMTVSEYIRQAADNFL